MDTPTENTEDKKIPKRLYFKIPKDYFTSSQAKQDVFVDAIIDQLMAQEKQNNEEKGKEKNERNG